MNRLKHRVKTILRPIMPAVHFVNRSIHAIPQVGQVQFGDLRRTSPISNDFGVDRGLPVDRYYIERFLAANALDIKGRVLEIGDDTYTRRFGAGRLTGSDILHVNDDNPGATIVADLASAPHIPDSQFDAAIVTQTLQYIYEPLAGLRTLHRILKPGGVLLLTVPGISSVSAGKHWGPIWYWLFTAVSMRRLCSEIFGLEAVQLAVHGNVLTATSLLHGLAAGELTTRELELVDPSYPVVITARITKA